MYMWLEFLGSKNQISRSGLAPSVSSQYQEFLRHVRLLSGILNTTLCKLLRPLKAQGIRHFGSLELAAPELCSLMDPKTLTSSRKSVIG